MIAEKVKQINKHFLDDEMAKGYIIDDKDVVKNSVRGLGRRRGGDWDTQTELLTSKNIEGSGFLSDIARTAQRFAPLALGKPKKGGMDWSLAGVLDSVGLGKEKVGAGWLDDFVSQGLQAVSMATGGRRRGRPCKGGIATNGIATGGIATGGRKRGRPRKGGIATGGIATGGGWLDDVLGKATEYYKKGKSMADKYAPLAEQGYELYKNVKKIREKKEEKKEEAKQAEAPQPVSRRGRRGRRGGIATGGMKQKLMARAVGGAYSDLEGAGWFDDVLDGIGKVADTAVKIKPLFKKGGILTAGGKKSSPWIAHVKKYAKAHNISYPEALKKAKASYK
jgi:hypothetical protein